MALIRSAANDRRDSRCDALRGSAIGRAYCFMRLQVWSSLTNWDFAGVRACEVPEFGIVDFGAIFVMCWSCSICTDCIRFEGATVLSGFQGSEYGRCLFLRIVIFHVILQGK